MNTGIQLNQLVNSVKLINIHRELYKYRNTTKHVGKYEIVENLLDVIEKNAIAITPMVDMLLYTRGELVTVKKRDRLTFSPNNITLPKLISKFGVSKLTEIFYDCDIITD